jgi:hypothetical protein
VGGKGREGQWDKRVERERELVEGGLRSDGGIKGGREERGWRKVER